MSPSYAWLGAAFGMLASLLTGLPPSGPDRVMAATVVADRPAVRQSDAGLDEVPPCTTGWGEADTSFARSILASVVTAGDAAWAIGLTSIAEDPRFPLAVRWDGTTWSDMPVGGAATERALFGVDRSPAGRLVAVGYRSRAAQYYPIMMRWDGQRWVNSSLGAVGSRGGALLSVRARSNTNTWAVGYQVDTSGQQPLAIRRVGSTWQRASPSIPRGATGALLDIDTRTTTDGWAVGWRAYRGAPQPYMARWNGADWRTETVERAGSEGAFTSVAAATLNDVWAVGYQVVAGTYQPAVQHWNGRRWRIVDFPRIDSGVAILRGVQIDADGQPMVVGTRWDATRGNWRGIAARRQDGQWYLMDVPRMPGGSELRALATRPDGSAWLVGANGPQSLATDLCPEPAAPGASPPVLPSPESQPSPMASPGAPVESASPSPAAPLLATPPPAVGVGPLVVPDATPEATPAASTAPVKTPRPSSRPAPTRRPGPSPRPTPTPPVLVRDVAREAGLGLDTASYGAVRADFDADGWPDLFIGRHSNPGWMAHNDGDGTFSDMPGVSIPRRDRHGCTTGDVNGDGLTDLYCANGALRGAALKSNELYVQQPDGTFVDQAMDMRATDALGRGRLSVLFDLDHDQYDDLFLADRPARTDGLPSIDRVMTNPTGKRFIAGSVAGFDPAGGADCLRAADLDLDGWEDVLLCERAMDPPGSYGIRILRNVRGRLVDVTRTSGIAKRQAVDAITADLDGDRRPDIVEVTPFQLRVHLRRGDGYVLGYTRPLRSGVAVGAGDVDGDGDIDLYVAQGNGRKQRADEMLLNKGDGRGFGTMDVPDAAYGSAESVTPIDYDRNGLTDFLVLNGKGFLTQGPVQLIAFFPRP